MNSDEIIGYRVQAEREIPFIFNIMWWLTEYVGKFSYLITSTAACDKDYKQKLPCKTGL